MSFTLLSAIAVGILLALYIYYSYNIAVYDIIMITGELGMLLTFGLLLSGVCKKYKTYLSFDTMVHQDLTIYLSSVNKS